MHQPDEREEDEMNSFETTIETTASTEQVLAVLTDPSAIRDWSPVPVEL